MENAVQRARKIVVLHTRLLEEISEQALTRPSRWKSADRARSALSEWCGDPWRHRIAQVTRFYLL